MEILRREAYPWNCWCTPRSFAPGACPWSKLQDENPSCVSAFISPSRRPQNRFRLVWNARTMLRLQAGNYFGLQLLSHRNRFCKLCGTWQKRYWLSRKGMHDRKRIGDQQMCFSFLSLFPCRVRPLLTGNRNLRLIMIYFFPAYWTNSSWPSSPHIIHPICTRKCRERQQISNWWQEERNCLEAYKK